MNITVNGVTRLATPEEEAELLAAQTLAQQNDTGNTFEGIAAIDAAKSSGYQKLIGLGLTEAEATALTGYTPPSE